jgi:hypothetical protein
MKSEWPHPALHEFIAILCVNVVFISHVLDTSISIIIRRSDEWQKEAMSDRNVHCIHNYGAQYYMDDGGSRFIHTMLYVCQTRYCIPEDMNLQSLPLESKSHLVLEILCTFNQNRTMENVQYMPVTTVKNLSTYITVIHNILKNIWILYITQCVEQYVFSAILQ